MVEDKSNHELPPRDRNCPICGAKEYDWGELRVGKNPPGDFVYYRPANLAWEDDVPTVVRRCLTCGNIQIFELDS